MNTIQLQLDGLHIYFLDRISLGNIKIVIDTGAARTIVFKDVLINKKPKLISLTGVGEGITSSSEGILVTALLSVKALYVSLSKTYDAILGLDWMIPHKATIDLINLKMIYE